jgi:hypothetical protein
VRAREFITESPRGGSRTAAAPEFETAHPGLVAPSGSGDVYWGRYYDFYRVSSLAGMDPKKLKELDQLSFCGNLPLFSAYTDYDREKLMAIMKHLKMKPHDYVSKGSRETSDVQVQSPVKPFAGYGR